MWFDTTEVGQQYYPHHINHPDSQRAVGGALKTKTRGSIHTSDIGYQRVISDVVKEEEEVQTLNTCFIIYSETLALFPESE